MGEYFCTKNDNKELVFTWLPGEAESGGVM